MFWKTWCLSLGVHRHSNKLFAACDPPEIYYSIPILCVCILQWLCRIGKYFFPSYRCPHSPVKVTMFYYVIVIVIVIYFTFHRSMIGNKTFGYRTSHNTTCNRYIHNTIYNSYINIKLIWSYKK